MVRLTLVAITLFVISLMFVGVSYGQPWYWEDFDSLNDGDVVGQGGWEIHPAYVNVVASTIQGDVAFGDTGKSLKVEGGQYIIRHFEGDHGGTQYISFFSRKDSDPGGRTNNYIGGGDVTWDGAAVFSMGIPNMLRVFNAGDHTVVAPIELGKWLHYHVVIDFGSETCDVYIDGELLADDFVFRGVGLGHASIDWWFLGSSKVEEAGGPLLAYIDNIAIGAGEGDPNMPPAAVSSSGKLATTWAELK